MVQNTQKVSTVLMALLWPVPEHVALDYYIRLTHLLNPSRSNTNALETPNILKWKLAAKARWLGWAQMPLVVNPQRYWDGVQCRNHHTSLYHHISYSWSWLFASSQHRSHMNQTQSPDFTFLQYVWMLDALFACTWLMYIDIVYRCMMLRFWTMVNWSPSVASRLE